MIKPYLFIVQVFRNYIAIKSDDIRVIWFSYLVYNTGLLIKLNLLIVILSNNNNTKLRINLKMFKFVKMPIIIIITYPTTVYL